MSLLLWIIWAAIMLVGNMLVATFCSAEAILWFNGIWITVFAIPQWVIPYFRQRINGRKNF